VFVTLTPAHDRPYADGSMHNSVFEQVFLYNGTGRFGDQPAYGLGYPATPSVSSVAYARRLAAFLPPAYQSRPGWDRLLTAPAAQVTGWLLVPAVIVAVAGIIAVSRAHGQAASVGLVPAAAGRLAIRLGRGPDGRVLAAPGTGSPVALERVAASAKASDVSH